MSELDWAMTIKQQPNLDEALDINESNIRGLLEEIRQLRKEVRELQRDKDVLYFELQNWKPEESEPKRRRGGIDIF